MVFLFMDKAVGGYFSSEDLKGRVPTNSLGGDSTCLEYRLIIDGAPL